MRFRYETYEEKYNRLEKPHRWFTLFPAFYEGHCYWLEYVTRQWVSIFTVRCIGYWKYTAIDKRS